jgi:PAS domain S-box-containing protein
MLGASERKRAEQLSVEKARLRDLKNDAILVRDAADRITFWNDGATEIYGYGRDEALGHVTYELFRTEFPEPLEHIREKLSLDGRWSGELRHTCASWKRLHRLARGDCLTKYVTKLAVYGSGRRSECVCRACRIQCKLG